MQIKNIDGYLQSTMIRNFYFCLGIRLHAGMPQHIVQDFSKNKPLTDDENLVAGSPSSFQDMGLCY